MLDGLCTLPLVPAVSGLFGYVVLEPIILTPAVRPASLRLSLSDVLCLFVMLAIPLGFTSIMQQLEGSPPGVVVIGLLLTGVFAYLWYRGTVMLTTTGVMQVRRRSLFLALLLPIAVLGCIAVVPALIAFLWFVISWSEYRLEVKEIVFALPLPTILIVAIASRRAVRWVINDPSARQPLPPETPPPAEPDPLRPDDAL